MSVQAAITVSLSTCFVPSTAARIRALVRNLDNASRIPRVIRYNLHKRILAKGELFPSCDCPAELHHVFGLFEIERLEFGEIKTAQERGKPFKLRLKIKLGKQRHLDQESVSVPEIEQMLISTSMSLLMFCASSMSKIGEIRCLRCSIRNA